MKRIITIIILFIISTTIVGCQQAQEEYDKSQAQGIDGKDGNRGKSAYEIWIEQGNEGNESTFISSLIGSNGTTGVGVPGNDGNDGNNGKSAYQIWLKQGNDGNESTFISSLIGNNGKDGNNGSNGNDGKSAYEVAVSSGFSGSATDWLNSLKGVIDINCSDGQKLIWNKTKWACDDIADKMSFMYFEIDNNNVAKVKTRDATVDTNQNEKFIFTINKIGLYSLTIQLNMIADSNSKWFRLSGQTGILVDETLTFRRDEAPYIWQGQYNIVLPVAITEQTFTIEMQDGVNLRKGTSVLLKAVSELSGLIVSDANMNYTTTVEDNGTVQNINANGATLESLECNTQQIPIYVDGIWKCVYNTNAFCRLQAKTDNPPAVTYDIINGCNSTFYKFDEDKIKVEHGANWFIEGNFNINPDDDGDVTVELYKNGYLVDKSIVYGYKGKTINLGVSTTMYMLNDHYFSIKITNGLLVDSSSFVHLHRLSAYNYFN